MFSSPMLLGKEICIPDLIKEKLVMETYTGMSFGLPWTWGNRTGKK